MSDLRQALQHGAPSEASKNKTVRNEKTLNNCFRKSLSNQVKSGSSKRVLRNSSLKLHQKFRRMIHLSYNIQTMSLMRLQLGTC